MAEADVEDHFGSKECFFLGQLGVTKVGVHLGHSELSCLGLLEWQSGCGYTL